VVFGLVRALPLLALRTATTPERLRDKASGLERLSRGARLATTGVLAAAAVGLVAA
jgi:hypothetical protein